LEELARWEMKIEAFHDKSTGTLTYVVYDEASKDAIVIDPVLDYEPRSSSTATLALDKVLDFLKNKELDVKMIAETHAHADHLSGAQLIKKVYPRAPIAIGHGITLSQQTFKEVFDLPADFPTDGSQFDRLLEDGETVDVGSLAFEVIATPGHTPGCSSYRFGDHVFTGDVLFMPDYGTGRCDFPGGSAATQFDSVTQRLYTLPEETITYVGHDYMPGGRELKYSATIAEQKASNVHIKATTSKEEFVRNKEAADAKKAAPRLLFQSVQVNIDAGRLPHPANNEIRYLKVPINVFPHPTERRPRSVGRHDPGGNGSSAPGRSPDGTRRGVGPL
jgi:glyoxylase-like metal-dependent hydrolase (beta-lactamase superfamily II)